MKKTFYTPKCSSRRVEFSCFFFMPLGIFRGFKMCSATFCKISRPNYLYFQSFYDFPLKVIVAIWQRWDQKYVLLVLLVCDRKPTFRIKFLIRPSSKENLFRQHNNFYSYIFKWIKKIE